MQELVASARASRVGLEQLLALAAHADRTLDALRTEMLEPHPRKLAPVFTGAEVARLAGIEPKQMNYLAKKGDLPSGVHEGNGTRRLFTLAETRRYVQSLGNVPSRPQGQGAAVIACCNFKGGSAKTTTTVNVAQGLTLRKGRRVLVVDLDPQGSATTLMGMLPAAEVLEEHTASPVFVPPLDEAPKDLSYAVQPTYWDGLDIIPAAPLLFNAEIFLPIHSRDPDIIWWDMLKVALEPLKPHYDYIILDTAPALSYLAVNAVMASDGLIMPLPPETLDFASSIAFWSMLSETLKSLKGMRNASKDFAFIKVLLSKVESKGAPAIMRDWISMAYGSYMMPVEVPKNQAGSISAIKFGTVYDMSKYGPQGESYAKGETYAKLRTAFDTVVDMIDQATLTNVWGVNQ